MVGVCTVCSGSGEVCLLSAERGAGGRRWHTPNTPIRTFPASAPCLGRERAGRVPGAGGEVVVLNSAPRRGTGFLTGFSSPAEPAGGGSVSVHGGGQVVPKPVPVRGAAAFPGVFSWL